MEWFLGYLLVGFALDFAGVQYYREPGCDDWKKELAAVIFWPLALAVMLLAALNRKSAS